MVNNIYLTNYGQNATQNRGEKYNIYLTNFGQNIAFWTFWKLRGYSWRAAEILKIERIYFISMDNIYF
jgi:hypothetical protein